MDFSPSGVFGKMENVKPIWVIRCTRRQARGAGGVRKGAFPDVQVELYAQGVSMNQISKVLAIEDGTAWNYVQRWKKGAGVVQRKPVVRR